MTSAAEPSAAVDLAREPDFPLGGLSISPSACRVRGPGLDRRVEPRIMEVLLVLTRSGGATVTRDQLIDACWGGRIVSDDAVSRAIAQVRSLARGVEPAPFVLETIPKVGFRLTVAEHGIEPPAPNAAATNLPAVAAALIGRETEAGSVDELLGGARMVTIAGPGGVGKTRLGLEVARRQLGRHEDGVWLTELAATTDPARVPELVAKGMHIELPANQDAAAVLIERLRRRRCLLVLDNCEHLVVAVAQLAEAILAQAPGVKLLLTSQEPLEVSGEHVFRLAPLPPPEAEALFVARARASEPDFDPAPEAEAIAAICRRLDGLPLALEMAAARAPALGCAAVLERLDDRFRILTDGRRTALPRHRTLLATLEWSHSLLSERDAVVFRRLGVFVGGFSLEAASKTAADARFDVFDVIDAVSSLAAKSLVTTRRSQGVTRHGLLETTRAFALERLGAAGELAELRRRHAEWCAQFAGPIWDDFVSQLSDAELLARYVPDFDNLHQALDWAYGEGGDPEIGHRILAASASLWDDLPLKRRLDVALPKVTAKTPAAVRAKLLASHAHVTMRLATPSALSVVDAAIEAMRTSVDDPVALCDVLASKGSALFLLGRYDDARQVADEMWALVAELPASRIKAFAIALDANLNVVEGELERGAARFDECVASLRAFGADGLANYWQWTALRRIPSADLDRDIEAWRLLLRRIRPGDMYGEQMMVQVARGLGDRLARRGAPADLREALELARAVFRTGAQELDRGLLLSLALVAAKSGRAEEAAAILGYVDARRRELGRGGGHGDFDAVLQRLADVLDEARIATLSAEGASLSGAEVARLALGGPSFETPGETPSRLSA